MFIYNSSGGVKKTVLLLCLWTFSSIIQAESAVNVDKQEVADDVQHRVYDFPKWPDKGPIRRERVPPPPPGPYMSSALSNYSFEGPSFASKLSDSEEPDVPFDKSDMTLQAFSQDVPWPSNVSAPNRWEPQNGYQYVEPGVVNRHYQVAPQDSYSNYNFGYGRNSVMTRPGTAWMPSTAVNPGNSFSRGGYVPAAGSSQYGARQEKARP